MTIENRYIKRVVVKDSASTPEARAERLRRVRNLANLTRKAMCDSNELNIGTYKSWELARFGGLPLDGAKKVCGRVAKEGVICKVEWLITGEGAAPLFIDQAAKAPESSDGTINSAMLTNELKLLEQSHENVVIFQVKNNGFRPFILKNDYVAGVKASNFEKLINRLCLIKVSSRKKLLLGELTALNKLENKLTMKLGLKNDDQINIETNKIDYIAEIIRVYSKPTL